MMMTNTAPWVTHPEKCAVQRMCGIERPTHARHAATAAAPLAVKCCVRTAPLPIIRTDHGHGG